MPADLVLGVLQLAVPTVIPVIGRLSERIIRNMKERKQLAGGLQKDIDHLILNVSLFKGIAQGPSSKYEDPVLEEWLLKLKEVLFDAEDLLDEYATDMALQEMEEMETHWSAKVRIAFTRSTNIASFNPSKFASNIRGINNMLDDLSTKRANLLLSKNLHISEQDRSIDTKSMKWRQTSSTPDTYQIVGRDGDKLNIKKIMLQGFRLRSIERPGAGRHGPKKTEGCKTLSQNNSYVAGVFKLVSPCSRVFFMCKSTFSLLVSSFSLLVSKTHEIPAADSGAGQLGYPQPQSCRASHGNEHSLNEVGSELSPSSHTQKPALSIIPIVGMGGIGKTTFARMIYNDVEIKDFFNLRLWVHVSVKFDKDKIISNIIQQINKSPVCQGTELELLETELRNLLQGNRVLLVLDDVWNDEVESWEKFLKPLYAATSMKQCIILITTRLTNITKAIRGCMEPIYLHGLENKELLQVLQEYAFRDCKLNNLEREMLQTIGMKIAQKLKGSPLAAKSIGRLLASEHTVEYWQKIAESDLWTLPQSNDDIVPILKLSYHFLPEYLKGFLIYFSLFPKYAGVCFRESEIINIWMAHNSVECGGPEIEYVAKKYCEDLIDRSFIECDHDMNYSIHDIMHDLLQSVSKYDFCLLTGDEKKEIHASVRHLSIASNKDGWYMSYLCKSASKYQKLRTLCICMSMVDDKFVRHICTHMRYLRILILRFSAIKVLPEAVSNLKHLRLLDLWDNRNIETLPVSLGCLYNLHVLNLTECSGLKDLPRTITRLVNLRQLIAHEDILSGIEGIGRLSLLQSLSIFSVRNKDGFRISELRDLNQLHESLTITNLDFVPNKDEAKQARLPKKTQLKDLQLHWSGRHEARSEMQAEILEALCPSENLRRITIYKYMGAKPPSWLNNLFLRFLESIMFQKCVKMEELPSSLGEMRLLKELKIVGMDSLKNIKCQQPQQQHQQLDGASSGVSLFPSLEELHIEDMPEWVDSWIVDEGKQLRTDVEQPITIRSNADATMPGISADSLPRLTKLVLRMCPKLKGFPTQAISTLKIVELSAVPMVASPLGANFRAFSCLESLILSELDWLCSDSWYEAAPINLQKQQTPRRNKKATLLPSSLQKLTLKNCQNLDDELLSIYLCTGGISEDSLPSLRELEITGCPQLTSCDVSSLITSLIELLIRNCKNMMSCRLPAACVTIQRFTINDCSKIESVWISSFGIFIEDLVIKNCPNLLYFGNAPPTAAASDSLPLYSSFEPTLSPGPLSGCQTLHLDIETCNRKQLVWLLHGINHGNLEQLTIQSCLDIEQFTDDAPFRLLSTFRQLSSLKTLHITGFLQLESLPQSIFSSNGLRSLDTMWIDYCPLLTSFPDLSYVTTLRNLIISNCAELRHLPGMNNVTSLESLFIYYCPGLQEKYEPRRQGTIRSDSNPHWKGISHIPNVVFR